ncbi:transcriptional regulator GlxA family with amidase domain [Streptosporangium album]|uniref:Transcriptional regulator GlxA family with amidase domain n=1 Tax=Streptosporangium album TaxID=47479 RepID=A0A7W7RY11_9ACTN|nr:helix-turn-helix transcriptional regulator [Streptosporangium album]MBB4940012.1 transcriptional regulator GlxA family with amidase domain [Streptosporangium album]
MARAAAVSPRHLTRLFHTELGTTPARWVEQVRLDHAQQLLLDGHRVTSAAHNSGFGTDETLRRAFDRHHGITPTAYRQRFTTTGILQAPAPMKPTTRRHTAGPESSPETT